MLTIHDLAGSFRAVRKREEGQTMAEYGVALSVITVASVAVFAAFAGGISGAVSRAVGLFPK
jgi:Flp pilus assembly pilin Flp